MGYLIIDTYHLFIRHWRASIRMPIWLFFNLIQPLVWLVLYGQLFKNMVLLPGFPTDSYLQYFAPGVITMTAFFGAGWSGMSIIQDIDHGVIDKMLTTPVNRVAIILGRVLHSASTSAIQGLFVLGISVMMGAKIGGGLVGALIITVTAMLVGIIFAAFSNAIAIILKKEDPVIAVINFFLMPLVFMSTIMMPAKFMPNWIHNVSIFNPVNWTVNTIRTIMIEGQKWDVIFPNLELLLVLSVISVLISTLSFRKIRE